MRDHLGVFSVTSQLQFAKGILLLEDCEGTCNWLASGTGADPAVTFETGAAWTGTYGMQLKTRITDPAEADYVQATKRMGWPESGLLVARCRFGMPDVSELDTIKLHMQCHNGTRQIQFGCQYEVKTPRTVYRVAGGGYTVLTGGDILLNDGGWVTMELVVDLNTEQYVRVALNAASVEPSGVGGYDADASTYKGVDIALYMKGTAEVPATAYVDAIYVGEFLNV